MFYAVLRDKEEKELKNRSTIRRYDSMCLPKVLYLTLCVLPCSFKKTNITSYVVTLPYACYDSYSTAGNKPRLEKGTIPSSVFFPFEEDG
jgi:hypothetical protein